MRNVEGIHRDDRCCVQEICSARYLLIIYYKDTSLLISMLSDIFGVDADE